MAAPARRTRATAWAPTRASTTTAEYEIKHRFEDRSDDACDKQPILADLAWRKPRQRVRRAR